MKRIISILLTVLLTSCSNPAGKAVKALGCTVKECCSSISITENNRVDGNVSNTKTVLPSLPASFQDILGSEMLTW